MRSTKESKHELRIVLHGKSHHYKGYRSNRLQDFFAFAEREGIQATAINKCYNENFGGSHDALSPSDVLHMYRAAQRERQGQEKAASSKRDATTTKDATSSKGVASKCVACAVRWCHPPMVTCHICARGGHAAAAEQPASKGAGPKVARKGVSISPPRAKNRIRTESENSDHARVAPPTKTRHHSAESQRGTEDLGAKMADSESSKEVSLAQPPLQLVDAQYFARLARFYERYAPHKLPTVENTLRIYAGNEEQLFQQLRHKYGPEPDDAYLVSMHSHANASASHNYSHHPLPLQSMNKSMQMSQSQLGVSQMTGSTSYNRARSQTPSLLFPRTDLPSDLKLLQEIASYVNEQPPYKKWVLGTSPASYETPLKLSLWEQNFFEGTWEAQDTDERTVSHFAPQLTFSRSPTNDDRRCLRFSSNNVSDAVGDFTITDGLLDLGTCRMYCRKTYSTHAIIHMGYATFEQIPNGHRAMLKGRWISSVHIDGRANEGTFLYERVLPPTGSVWRSSTLSYRDRLKSFYLHYAPEKLAGIDSTLKIYAGQEESMFAKLVRKYGPEPAPADRTPPRQPLQSTLSVEAAPLPPPVSASSSTADHNVPAAAPMTREEKERQNAFRTRLIRFYEHYAPAKLLNVDSVLTIYKGREQEMFAKFEKKYGAEPPKPLEDDEQLQAPLPAQQDHAGDTAAPLSTGSRRMRDRLIRYYNFYNPQRVPFIDSILSTYRGRETQMFAKLFQKYGPEEAVPQPSPSPPREESSPELGDGPSEAQQAAPRPDEAEPEVAALAGTHPGSFGSTSANFHSTRTNAAPKTLFMQNAAQQARSPERALSPPQAQEEEEEAPDFDVANEQTPLHPVPKLDLANLPLTASVPLPSEVAKYKPDTSYGADSFSWFSNSAVVRMVKGDTAVRTPSPRLSPRAHEAVNDSPPPAADDAPLRVPGGFELEEIPMVEILATSDVNFDGSAKFNKAKPNEPASPPFMQVLPPSPQPSPKPSPQQSPQPAQTSLAPDEGIDLPVPSALSKFKPQPLDSEFLPNSLTVPTDTKKGVKMASLTPEFGEMLKSPSAQFAGSGVDFVPSSLEAAKKSGKVDSPSFGPTVDTPLDDASTAATSDHAPPQGLSGFSVVDDVDKCILDAMGVDVNALEMKLHQCKSGDALSSSQMHGAQSLAGSQTLGRSYDRKQAGAILRNEHSSPVRPPGRPPLSATNLRHNQSGMLLPPQPHSAMARQRSNPALLSSRGSIAPSEMSSFYGDGRVRIRVHLDGAPDGKVVSVAPDATMAELAEAITEKLFVSLDPGTEVSLSYIERGSAIPRQLVNDEQVAAFLNSNSKRKKIVVNIGNGAPLSQLASRRTSAQDRMRRKSTFTAGNPWGSMLYRADSQRSPMAAGTPNLSHSEFESMPQMPAPVRGPPRRESRHQSVFSPKNQFSPNAQSSPNSNPLMQGNFIPSRRLVGHEGPVLCCAFVPQSTSAVSVGKDGTCRIWDLKSGECRGFRPHTGGIALSCRGSPDGSSVVTAGDDRSIVVTSIAYDECEDQGREAVLRGHTHKVCQALFSPTGDIIASSSVDSSIRIWDLERQACLRSMTIQATNERVGRNIGIFALGYGVSSDLIVSGSDDKSVRLWDPRSGAAVRILTGHTGTVWSTEFFCGNEKLVSTGVDCTVRTWDVGTGRILRSFTNHTGPVHCAVPSAQGQLVSCGRDCMVLVQDSETGEVLSSHKPHHGSVYRADVFGTKLLSCSQDATLCVSDLF